MEKQLILDKIFKHVKRWSEEFRRQSLILAGNSDLNYLRHTSDPLADIVAGCQQIQSLNNTADTEIWQTAEKISKLFDSRISQVAAMRSKIASGSDGKPDSRLVLLNDIHAELNKKINEGISLNNENTQFIFDGRFPAYETEIVADKIYEHERGLENRYRTASEEANKKINQLFENYEDAIKNIKDKDTQIKTLLGQLGTQRLAGVHSNTSKNYLKAANRFLIGSFSLMVIPAALLGWTLFDSHTDQINTISLISRLSVTAFLSVPITYLLREAGRFRTIGNRYLQTAVDLKALNPYLAALEPEVQQQIRTALANKMFFSYAEGPNSDIAISNLQDMAMKALDFVPKPK